MAVWNFPLPRSQASTPIPPCPTALNTSKCFMPGCRMRPVWSKTTSQRRSPPMGSCDNLDKPDLSNTVIFEYSKEGWKSSAIRYRSFLTCEDRGTAEDTTPALAMDFEIYYSAQGND